MPPQSDTPTPAALPAAQPSLDEQIGQMLMLGFRALTVDETSPIVEEIQTLHLGGVVLFDVHVPTWSDQRNIASPAQLAALTTGLQAAASTPLLIAVDQEGGRVARLKEKHGFPPSPSPQSLGERDDLAYTAKVAGIMAQTLAEMGINLNLAPGVDLNSNPDNPVIGSLGRSFGADPELVTRHALAFIQAHHDHGVGCTLKHFPGHGSSAQDSHTGFVDVSQSWRETELIPYQRIIDAGMADAIMTAHVFNSAWDPALPATLSSAVITGMLREKLGWDGVVISDDMMMGALTENFSFETAIRLTILAGVDILAIANNSQYDEWIGRKTHALIRRMVEQGEISPARIAASYQRIQRLKERLQSD